MVIKKDPRALLDMLNRPVECDDDEFLDKLDANKSFHDMPSKPTADLKVGAIMNEAQQKMLGAIGDIEVDEEDLVNPAAGGAGISGAPVDLTDKERRFFSLFKGVGKKDQEQAAVPENLDLGAVGAASEVNELPRVGDTVEEKEAKQEDLERRAAYIEAMAKNDQGKQSDGYDKTHDRFVATFGDVPQQH